MKRHNWTVPTYGLRQPAWENRWIADLTRAGEGTAGWSRDPAQSSEGAEEDVTLKLVCARVCVSVVCECVSYVSCIGRWVLFYYHHLGSPHDPA